MDMVEAPSMIALTLTFILGIIGLFAGPGILPVALLIFGIQTGSAVKNIEAFQENPVEATEQVTPDEEAPAMPEVHTPSFSQ